MEIFRSKKKAAAKATANAAYLRSLMLISGMTTKEIDAKEASWNLPEK